MIRVVVVWREGFLSCFLIAYRGFPIQLISIEKPNLKASIFFISLRESNENKKYT